MRISIALENLPSHALPLPWHVPYRDFAVVRETDSTRAHIAVVNVHVALGARWRPGGAVQSSTTWTEISIPSTAALTDRRDSEPNHHSCGTTRIVHYRM